MPQIHLTRKYLHGSVEYRERMLLLAPNTWFELPTDPAYHFVNCPIGRFWIDKRRYPFKGMDEIIYMDVDLSYALELIEKLKQWKLFKSLYQHLAYE